MIRLVLYDIDGTLLHTGGAGVKAFAKAFSTEFGIHDGTEKLKFAGRTDVSLVREFFGHHQIEASAKNFERFFETYLGLLEPTLKSSEGGICKGAMEFYEQLQKLPNPPLIGLLTGNIRQGARLKLQHYHLWEKFAFGGFADDHEERDHIAAAAKRRGSETLGRELHGSEVVVIGDTPLDIRCARAIHAKVIAVATGNFRVEELQQFSPDWAVEDLSQLTAYEVVAMG